MQSLFPHQTLLFWLRNCLYSWAFLKYTVYQASPGRVTLLQRKCGFATLLSTSDGAVETVSHSQNLSRSQWPHLIATCLRKWKGGSNLDIKSLLGPWWHWLRHAYQCTGCDACTVEFALIRCCRRLTLWRFTCESYKTVEQLGCRGTKEKVTRKISENLPACFYQEYANKCMLDGNPCGMWISSRASAAHANVLIGHFARRSAM